MSREDAGGGAPTALARIDSRLLLGMALAIVALAAVAGWAYRGAGEPVIEDAGMAGMDGMAAPTIPAVEGYYAGEQILFLHTPRRRTPRWPRCSAP